MTKWAKYGKIYNAKWEEDEDLKNWIRPAVGDKTRAFCRFCKCEIRAHRSDLNSHAATSKHKRNADRHSSCQTIALNDVGAKRTRKSKDNVMEPELQEPGEYAVQIDCNSSALTVDQLQELQLEMFHDLRDALPPQAVSNLVKLWLNEDIPSFDFGGMVVGNETKCAHLFMKSTGFLSGVPFFEAVFKELGCKVSWCIDEGDYINLNRKSKIKIGAVEGPCRRILLGERTALNCLARTSGITTLAQTYQEIVKGKEWKGCVAGTRKTTPGFRLVEKYALLVAGIDTHRYNLSTMVMLKDNHINAAGSIQQAVQKAKAAAGFSVKIEVECSSLCDGLEAARAGADIVMFDNFTSQDLHTAAKAFKKDFPDKLVEASGGITQENLVKYCSPFVDIISTSKLVQGYPVVDFSLKIAR
uniref:Nicotinate-nucleotide pyrophosphorylase [carboxylating] n=1 Tax=Phallusia mammillata TaxID=59560 RepID=A0A6F9DPH9_9ASCI|nr:nicotinate-nucleotide pyrophosphorylase [carboxylating] [Phallusia mammillata]